MTHSGPKFAAQQLAWRDISLGVITLTNGNCMRVTLGLGSGLSQRAGDPKGTIWAITDRGPNLKIKPALERYGLEHLELNADRAIRFPCRYLGASMCGIERDGLK